jgi:glutathione synthase/RimK-type ligase-like ATP-grasp enzyme
VAILIVVNNPERWPMSTPGVQVVSARSYVSDRRYADLRGAKIFNLCKSYKYQSIGYYVSLLAEARGHRPLPSITTIQDLKSASMVRLAGDDLEELVQHSLKRLHTESFTLSIYFGRNIARRYDRLALHIFNMFPAPLLRAHFEREPARPGETGENGKPGVARWRLVGVQAISSNDIPPEHLEFVVQGAQEYFAGKRRVARKAAARYDLAILFERDAPSKPSTNKTIDKFIRAAKDLGIEAEIIGKDDYGRLAEFDGLFIRETTAVNHHTYRFSRRATAEGLVVIDDPESIVRCSNKVFLAEAMEQNHIRAPRTLIVHRDNIEDIPLYVGFPCVLKQPDSAFSLGVIRVDEPSELEAKAEQFLSKSDLVIAQEFLPSSFDWRVGVLDRKILFVCKYHMVKGHWQIAVTDKKTGERDYGKVESVPIHEAPAFVVRAGLRAAQQIGDGLYGVDVKQIGNKAYVIEVNDNPNVDAGYEDQVLGDELYTRIMRVFLERMEARRRGPQTPARGRTPVLAPARNPLVAATVGARPIL